MINLFILIFSFISLNILATYFFPNPTSYWWLIEITIFIFSILFSYSKEK